MQSTHLTRLENAMVYRKTDELLTKKVPANTDGIRVSAYDHLTHH